MNRLNVIGRLVRENDVKEVGDGRVVLNNSLAIPRTFKSNGQQETDFINIVAWGKRALLIQKYVNKGDLVGLDGKIQSRSYQNKDDQKVFIVEMVVESVHFLQPKRDE